MADTAEEHLGKEPPEEHHESFWAGFSPDVRMLIVTVAGTVIGGTLLVIVLAIAVIAALVHRHPTRSPLVHREDRRVDLRSGGVRQY